MITPKLEELIWCGKAFFKTAVVGGSKSTINIDNDRFIIITDITFLPYFNQNADTNFNRDVNTQLSIYGERGFNHYFFANARPYVQTYYDTANLDQVTLPQKMSMPPQKIDCYLLHTTQVGFSFIVDAAANPTSTLTIAPPNNPAYEPPLDYGKDGMTGALNIDNDITQAIFTLLPNQVVNRLTGLPVGSNVTQQIQLPAEAGFKPVVTNNKCFPIANINYIEVLGQPNNIGL